MMDRKENDLIDNSGMFTRPITYSEFKNNLDLGRKKILDKYETSIIDLFSALKNDNVLRTEFTYHDIERTQKLQYTSSYVNSVINNSYTIAGKFQDVDFMNRFLTVGKDEGY